MKLATPWRLRRSGIMGINARNHHVVQALNPRRCFPLVDDKRLTKEAMLRWDIPTPPHIGAIHQHNQVRRLGELIGGRERFVVKPCRGSGGKGIIVITGRDGEDFIKASGKKLSMRRLQSHIANTLSGLYSLTGRPDGALLEDCIVFSDVFDRFAHQGVPDIRVIVYRGYPLAAMMRLPTKSADGKANLHQGAIGVGIDLVTAAATDACQWNRPCRHHPDTGADLRELTVPDWQRCLQMAARCYDMSSLGYFGADIVLDAERGPVILELNARPGLSIQLATGRGLRAHFTAIDRLPRDPLPSPEERVELAIEAWRSMM